MKWKKPKPSESVPDSFWKRADKIFRTSYYFWALLLGMPGFIMLWGPPPKPFVNKRNPSIVYPWQSYGIAGISLAGAAYLAVRGWKQNKDNRKNGKLA